MNFLKLKCKGLWIYLQEVYNYLTKLIKEYFTKIYKKDCIMIKRWLGKKSKIIIKIEIRIYDKEKNDTEWRRARKFK